MDSVKIVHRIGLIEEVPALAFANLHRFDENPPPPREWVVEDRIPLRNVTLLSGAGATGKSLLLLQLLAATVLGRGWLDTLPEIGPALYLSAEEDLDEIGRRLGAILEHLGASYNDIADDLHVLSQAGEDAVLGAADRRSGLVRPTPLFEELLKAGRRIQPRLIGLDTAADCFAGNENDRAQVRQFIGLLRKLAIAANSAVILVSHPSLQGINSGSGLSGSTAWHNSTRARMILQSAKAEEGGVEDPDLRELVFAKNNYGPIAESVALRWQDGVFVVKGTGTGFLDKLAGERRAEDAFLALLQRFVRQGQHVSGKKGPTYAPAIFAEHPEAKGLNRQALAKAMQRLLDAEKIRIEEHGPPSHRRSRLVLP